MATIEKLFNFEERQQAQDILGQKEDLGFGALMPTGYGAIGAGVNKLGRNIFGNNDPVLKERAAIEGALLETQNELTPEQMADPSVLYPTMMAKLKNLNVNPKMVLGLQQIMQDQLATKSTAEYNNLYKMSTVRLAENEADRKKTENEEKARTKRETIINREFEILKKGDSLLRQVISNESKGLINNLESSEQKRLVSLVENRAKEIYLNDFEVKSISEAMTKAANEIMPNVKEIDEFGPVFLNKNKFEYITPVESATSVNTDLLNEKLKNYQPKTGN
jgi:hypothetical protein